MSEPRRPPRVLLMSPSVRTSAKGRQYMSGYLRKARVIAFAGEPDKWGNPRGATAMQIWGAAKQEVRYCP